jgi:hypothetical protein
VAVLGLLVGRLRLVVGRLLRRVLVGVLLLVWVLIGPVLAGILKLIANLAAGILKLPDALAQAPRQLRNFISTKENENDDHNQNQFGAADIAKKKQGRSHIKKKLKAEKQRPKLRKLIPLGR